MTAGILLLIFAYLGAGLLAAPAVALLLCQKRIHPND